MDRTSIQSLNGVLQVIWGIGAFLYGMLIYALLCFIAVKGWIFQEPPTLSTFDIFLLVSMGLVIVVGCGSAVFFGVCLVKSTSEKKKALITKVSVFIMSVPPSIAFYYLIKYFHASSTVFLISPTAFALFSPLVIVFNHILSLFLKKPKTELKQ